MRLISLLLLLFSLTSCGVQLNKKHTQNLKGSRQFSKTASEFSEYVQRFEAAASEHFSSPNFKVGDIPINFGDTTKDEFDGVCNSYSDGTKEILIKKSWWKSTSEAQKEIMIFHELGHCRLGRGHDSELLTINGSTTIKASIMNPTIPSNRDYEAHRNGYLRELFLGLKDKLDTTENKS